MNYNKINLSSKFVFIQNDFDCIYFRGHFFIDDKLYFGEAGANYILRHPSFIPENGFFSIVKIKEDIIKIISDKSGSIIVYYLLNYKVFII